MRGKEREKCSKDGAAGVMWWCKEVAGKERGNSTLRALVIRRRAVTDQVT